MIINITAVKRKRIRHKLREEPLILQRHFFNECNILCHFWMIATSCHFFTIFYHFFLLISISCHYSFANKNSSCFTDCFSDFLFLNLTYDVLCKKKQILARLNALQISCYTIYLLLIDSLLNSHWPFLHVHLSLFRTIYYYFTTSS